MGKNGQWARKFERCQECDGTARPHYAKGFCDRCYMRLYKRQKRREEKQISNLKSAR